MRMTLSKEYEEQLDDEDEVEMTEEEKSKIDDRSAMSRQTFDPVEKIYDDRKRLATVTLPKPAKLQDEANLELRRNAQGKAYNEYRVANTMNEKGEQQPNLTSDEQDGLKSIMKKI